MKQFGHNLAHTKNGNYFAEEQKLLIFWRHHVNLHKTFILINIKNGLNTIQFLHNLNLKRNFAITIRL